MAQLGVDRPTGAPRRGPAPAHACVSEDDVATIAVAALRARWTIGERLPINGPEVLSWDEVVDQCGRETRPGRLAGVGRDPPPSVLLAPRGRSRRSCGVRRGPSWSSRLP